MTPGLVFDPVEHRYFLDGRELPGITRVLRDVGIGPLPQSEIRVADSFAYAAERGKAVHEATALDDRGELDEESVDPVVRPYLDAWRRFREESGFRPEPTLIEVPLARSDLGFAGTPDRAGILGEDRIVLEIKVTAEMPSWVGLQLAGQRMLAWTTREFGAVVPNAVRRFAVQLRPDGTYRLWEFRDPEDGRVFLACLSIYQWKAKNPP